MTTNPVTAQLDVMAGSETRQVILDPGSVCRIGRDEQSTIVLADKQVSRQHAMVQCGPAGQCLLSDLGSRNGTWLNQRRVIAPAALKEGDRVQIGDCVIVFHGSRTSETGQAASAGETVLDFSDRLITVLVVDIRGFTGLASRLPGARLSEVISAFFRESGTVLAEQGAWTQKYIGDAVMAIWLHADDPPALGELVPVLSALEKIFGIAAGLQPVFDLDTPIRIGAGINTGIACVGNMGSEASSDYTALSDAVNLAFRLESATKEIGCDIALGKSTHTLLGKHPDAACLFEQHLVHLKGYQDAKPAFAAREAGLAALLGLLRGQPSTGSASDPNAPVGRGVTA